MTSILVSFFITYISSLIGIPIIRKFTQRVRYVEKKETLYGEEAVEFNKIRARDEKNIPAARMGGLLFVPVLLLVLLYALFIDQKFLILGLLVVLLLTLVAIYDDLCDIGRIKRNFGIKKRLLLIFILTLLPGYVFYQAELTTLFGIDIGWLIIPFVALWFLFWQLASPIDGIDGISGLIFLALFFGTAVLSLIQGINITYILSIVMIGSIIAFLMFNLAPAKVFLTETGITILLSTFAYITLVLGLGNGDGIWLGLLFGLLLIFTWVSNIIQLTYRRVYGKKLFKLAPIHHHFEAIGVPSSTVAMMYGLITLLLVILGLSSLVYV